MKNKGFTGGAYCSRISLDTAEARQSLKFTEVKDGNDRRIVVDAVAVGSQAEQVTSPHYVEMR